ncbi:MAG: hypothetical protein ACJARI_003013, partial [Bacteroidia bacterium]
MIQRLGITFALASDPEQKVVKGFGVQNPQTNELALHAVYIVDERGRVIYRKVAGRRPVSAELIDAIDAHGGVYPRNDQLEGLPERRVAYPSNNSQTLIEMSNARELPNTVLAAKLAEVLASMRAGSSDDTLIAFRAFIKGAQDVPLPDLLATAAWLTRQRFIADIPAATKAGLDLQKRLRRVAELKAQSATAQAAKAENADTLLHTLAAARGGLSKARAAVTNNAGVWR